MKCWYPTSPLRNRVVIITDIYDEYVEVRDVDSGKYYIVLLSMVEPIDFKFKLNF